MNSNIIRDNKILADELTKTLFEIADFDYEGLEEKAESGIFDGYGSLSLFFFHLYRFTDNQRYREKFLHYFEKAFNSMEMENLNLSYGASGVMWLLNLYIKKKCLNLKYNDYLDAYDDLLVKRIDEYGLNIDTMHGLLSIANYLLERKSHASDICLNKIVDIIDENKICIDNGITWKGNDSVELNDDQQYFSFGYAHGIPAILWFLCRFISRGIKTQKTKSLFNKGFIFFNANKLNGLTTHFPAVVMKNSIRQTSRIAFCYGDLGIAAGLTMIAKNNDNRILLKDALAISLDTAQLSLKPESHTNDIGLCHGAAGNGFLFSRLYKIHKAEILREAAIQQFKRLISLKMNGHGIAGFTSIDYDSSKGHYYKKTDKGFINGTAGVGLSIISLLSNDKIQYWDNLLYLK